VWIGFDDKRKSLGAVEQGSLAALPMWMEFMKAHIDLHTDKDDPPQFTAPGNIVFADADGVNEAFIAGTQPGGFEQRPPQ